MTDPNDDGFDPFASVEPPPDVNEALGIEAPEPASAAASAPPPLGKLDEVVGDRLESWTQRTVETNPPGELDEVFADHVESWTGLTAEERAGDAVQGHLNDAGGVATTTADATTLADEAADEAADQALAIAVDDRMGELADMQDAVDAASGTVDEADLSAEAEYDQALRAKVTGDKIFRSFADEAEKLNRAEAARKVGLGLADDREVHINEQGNPMLQLETGEWGAYGDGYPSVDRGLGQEQAVGGLGAGVEVGYTLDATPEDGWANDAVGANQRLRIAVPNVFTQLTLGHALASRLEDDTRPAYAGCGVATDANIFLHADRSTMIQGEHAVHIVSSGEDERGEVNIGATNDITAATKTGSVVLNGGGGVTIAGRISWEVEPTEEDGVEEIPRPAWIDEAAATAEAISNTWSVVDGAVSAISAGITLCTTDWSSEAGSGMRCWSGLSTALNVVNMGLNAANVADAAPSGGTTVFGTTGLVLGTAGMTGIYALAGVGIASPVSCSMMANLVGMSGRHSAQVASLGRTSVFGTTGLELTSASTTQLASRQGSMAVLGSSIDVGSLKKEGPQEATKTLTAQATDQVWVSSERTVALGGKSDTRLWSNGETIVMGGKRACVVAGKSAFVAAERDVSLHAGPDGVARLEAGHYGVTVTSTEVLLGPVDGQAHEGVRGKLVEELAALEASQSSLPVVPLMAFGPEFETDTIQQRLSEMSKRIEELRADLAKLDSAPPPPKSSVRISDDCIELSIGGDKSLVGSGGKWKIGALEIKTG